MLTIRYDACEGIVVPDGLAETYVLDTFTTTPEASVTVSSEVVVTAARVLVREGRIPHDAIRFEFEDAFLHPDEEGRLSAFPQGFCDTSLDLTRRLVVPRKVNASSSGS